MARRRSGARSGAPQVTMGKAGKGGAAKKGAGKAGKGGAGKGGKDAGGWVWVPSGRGPMSTRLSGALAAKPTSWPVPKVRGKFNGKGSAKGSGKAKKKGGPKELPKTPDKIMEKLGKIDAPLKVWVGGLSPKTTWKQLAAHFETVKKPQTTAIMPKGKACIAYETEEDASDAIASLNGSELDGKTIQVDVWTQKEKKEKTGEDKPKKKKVKKHTLKVKKHKLKVKIPLTKAEEKIKEKLKGIDASLKVWVGGLKPETSWKVLQKHFSDVAKPKVTNIIGNKGTACLAFETTDEVASAIATLNGSELNGKVLEVDSWERPERKKKVKKEE